MQNTSSDNKRVMKLHIAGIFKGTSGSSKPLTPLRRESHAGTSHITDNLDPSSHAETNALKEMVYRKKVTGVMWSIRVRVTENGDFTMHNAKPCLNCTKNMIRYGIKKCVYTNYYGQLVVEKLTDILKTATLSLGYVMKNISVPRLSLHIQKMRTYELLLTGKKSIEGRRYKGHIVKFKPGMQVILKCGEEQCIKMIRDIYHHRTFGDMIDSHKLINVLPDCSTKIDAIRTYQSYYKKEGKEGVVAIRF